MTNLIFDFDGVIVESEKKGFSLIQKLINDDFGINVPDNLFTEKVGKPAKTFLVDNLGDKLTNEEIERTFSKLKDETLTNLTDYITPHKKVMNFIRSNSSNYNIAIASMNTKNHIEKVLQHYNLKESIKAVVSVEDVTKHKPDPEIYTKALDMLEAKAEDSFAIEDSPSGVKAANNAQIGCYVVLNGLNKESDFDGLNVLQFIDVNEFDLRK